MPKLELEWNSRHSTHPTSPTIAARRSPMSRAHKETTCMYVCLCSTAQRWSSTTFVDQEHLQVAWLPRRSLHSLKPYVVWFVWLSFLACIAPHEFPCFVHQKLLLMNNPGLLSWRTTYHDQMKPRVLSALRPVFCKTAGTQVSRVTRPKLSTYLQCTN